MLSFKKVGVMYHWRIGRLGGSIYLKRKAQPQRKVKTVDIKLSAYDAIDMRGVPTYRAPRNWQTAVARFKGAR